MTKVRARRECYLEDQVLHKRGQIFEYDGAIDGRNVVPADAPLDDEERAAVEAEGKLTSAPPWTTPGFTKQQVTKQAVGEHKRSTSGDRKKTSAAS